MYAAVKRVLREQERQQRNELELERKRLERLLQLHLQSTAHTSRRHSAEDIADGDTIPILVPFPREILEQLQRSLPPAQGHIPGDISLLGTLRPGLFRISNVESSSKSQVKRSSTDSTIPPPRSILPGQIDVKVGNDSSSENLSKGGQSSWEICGRRWTSRILVVTSGVIALLSGIILCVASRAYKDLDLTYFILLLVLGLLLLIFGLILIGINVSILHPCLLAGPRACWRGRNSSNAVGLEESAIELDAGELSVSSAAPVQDPQPIGIYMKK